VFGALTMFDRTREQPARVFGMEWVVCRAEVSGESTHPSSFTSVPINTWARSIAHQKVFCETIDTDSLDVSDYV